MQTFVFLLFINHIIVLVVPLNEQKIVGGTEATINQYPFVVALLFSRNLASYYQVCGGSILTTRAILSAAHCGQGEAAIKWRVRVGSSWANTGGTVYIVEKITIHPQYNTHTFNNDVALMHTKITIAQTAGVQAGTIAGFAYILEDNQPVWAIGWGATTIGGQSSERLRHVQIWTINQVICGLRYAELGLSVTDSMLCSGWLDVGGRDQCQGDSGGPLIHNGVIVGICSWGYQCAHSRYPGVNVRVSNYTSWILANV